METKNTITALALSLDWNTEPRPSPYQVQAWEKLKAHAFGVSMLEVLDVLESTRQKMLEIPSYVPYNYAAKLLRGW